MNFSNLTKIDFKEYSHRSRFIWANQVDTPLVALIVKTLLIFLFIWLHVQRHGIPFLGPNRPQAPKMAAT